MLQINLQSTAPVLLHSNCGGAGSLSALAQLINRELIAGGDENLLPNVLIEKWHCQCEKMAFSASLACAFKYDHAQQCFYCFPQDQGELSNFRASRLAANYLQFAIVSAMLRGSKLLMVHGALLNVRDGVLLLLGEGGVGKSTTACRWQEAGQTAVSDDMFLIEYGSEELWVHPMPTWSACAESMSGLRYPINDAYPVKGVLCAARGEEFESTASVSKAEYFTQIYSSCLFFNRRFANMLKDERREMILNAVRECADILSDRFEPEALFANLNGDIVKTLEKFL